MKSLKRHKLLRRAFSTVMALVLAVSLLPTYAFAASVPTSTTTSGSAADFAGAWKSAHYKPGTYTVTANLAMPGEYNPILKGVTVYANNPNNPFGATDPDDPCENVDATKAPTTPLTDNATLTVKGDGTLELHLGIHNPIFTTQKVGTCPDLAYTATRLEKTYSSSGNSVSGRVYQLDATLGKTELDANGVATYNFKGSELFAVPLALSFKPDGDIALQLTVDLSAIPQTADYTAVTAALAKVPADLSAYTDETAAAVTAAVSAVSYDKTSAEQAEVDAMAKAIEDAVAALVKKDGGTEPDPSPRPKRPPAPSRSIFASGRKAARMSANPSTRASICSPARAGSGSRMPTARAAR